MLHSGFVSRCKKNLVSQCKPRFALLLQIYESSDKPRLAVVLVFVCYLFQNKTEEDLLSKCAVLKLFLFPTTYLQSWIFKVCGNKI